MLRRKLKVQIVHEIKRVVKSILDHERQEEASAAFLNEDEIPSTAPNPSNCVLSFLFPLKTFHLLQDRGVLPEFVEGKRVKYELDSNRLLVRVMPSVAHDGAAHAWNDHIVLWSTNRGAGANTLRHRGGGRTCYVQDELMYRVLLARGLREIP